MLQSDLPVGKHEVFQGKYNLSIGTSLGFETLFGVNDNIVPTNPLPYTKYRFVLINVRTLIRNIYGAVEKELKTEFLQSKYLDKVIEEILYIPHMLENQSQGTLTPLFYIPSYRGLERQFPKALLKKAGKKAYGKQHQEAIEQYCVAQLVSRTIRGEFPINLVDIDLPPVTDTTIILTHQPVDLLSYVRSNVVDLLETHTGAIKNSRQWYTKLSGKGLEQIPFDKWSLQFFGDGKLFNGMPPKFREKVVLFAGSNKWNQSTTPDLIRLQLKRFPDKEIATTIVGLL